MRNEQGFYQEENCLHVRKTSDDLKNKIPFVFCKVVWVLHRPNEGHQGLGEGHYSKITKLQRSFSVVNKRETAVPMRRNAAKQTLALSM